MAKDKKKSKVNPDKLGSGLLGTAARALGNRDKQLQKQIEAATGIKKKKK